MQKKALLFYGFVLFIVLPASIFAADIKIKSVGAAYVQNYYKSVYQAANQNWSVTKDEHGIMYFGNSEGLLSYDGRYWQLYHMPNRLIVRSVSADGKGRVYVGGFGEFGYWQNNAKGFLTYNSLINLLPKNLIPTEEIWKIYVDGNRVLFQGFGAIYIYENGKIKAVKVPNQPYLFLYKVNHRFIIERSGVGLFELVGNKLLYLPGTNVVGKSGVLSIMPYAKNDLLIGTAKDGLFLYNGINAAPFKNDANDFLKKYQLNNGSLIQRKYFAYGTILNGVIIIDSTGKIVQHINKLSGLQNNTVLGLYTDGDQNLWASLDNGIDRIELNSPLYFYEDKTGNFGTVYSSIIFNNKIYLGTNQGLFYSDWNTGPNNPFKTFDFKMIPGSQGQVWDLSLIDGRLLCGHNNGTYEVDGSTMKNISAQTGGWTIKKLGKDHLIQGTYTGLAIYKKDNAGNWIFDHKVQNYEQPSTYVEQDNEGYVWISHAYKGVYKIKLSDDLKRAVTVKYYDTRQGLPSSYHVNIFSLNKSIVFSSDSGFYYYDAIADRFYKYDRLNSMLGSFATSNKIIPAFGKKYWFINHGHVALTDFSVAGKLKIDSSRFSILNGQMVQHYENISRIDDQLHLISIDNGFVIFNAEDAEAPSKTALPRVMIRQVENISNNPETLTEDAYLLKNIDIPYKDNSIRIYYSIPFYKQANIKFQYYLEGYSSQWSAWSNESQKDFTSLGAGTYTFKVRALINGTDVSEITSAKITILAPWYATKLAYVCYLLLLIPFYYLIRSIYRRKLTRHQDRIQQIYIHDKQEAIRRETMLKEQEIIRIKNEQLLSDLESKNRELSNSTMNIVYKNELLQKLSEEIAELKDEKGRKLSADQTRKIQKVIDEGMNDERDWNLFENSFNEAHENFFKKLKVQYPDLVPNDLKLCAYLRMNMSSKEIASLLNISLRGVEIRRYRLRKKLMIDHDKNLSEFLIEL
jgi:ligand-binding sensor domain-containing protein/DNA-binding CsgD family transcriptional regulator